MNQRKKIIGIIVGVIIGGIIIGLKVNKENEPIVSKDDIYQCFLNDNFSSDSKIEKKIQEEIKITIDKVESTSFHVEIEAPDIAEELFMWIDSQEDESLTSEKIEEKILILISELPKEQVSYKLYYKNEENIEIGYTQECKNALSCGMIDFYDRAMQQVIEEMKEGEH